MNEYIEKISNLIPIHVKNINWIRVEATFTCVSIYSQLLGKVTLTDSKRKLFSFWNGNYQEDPTALLISLRELMGKEQEKKGAWYIARMEIPKNGKFNIQFDYDTKPDLSFEIPDEVFIEDFEQFPRDEQYIPDWLREILVRHGKL
ncbi:MAG: DUF600 family protein [Spirosomataceae bacterium]